jgi:hypothetical protein
MSKLDKYIDLAKDLNMANAKIISPADIFFDIRAILQRHAVRQKHIIA